MKEIYDIDIGDIYSKGRQSQVEARSLLCYWAVRELGMSATYMAKRLGMSQSGVGYAVSRGEKIAKKKNYQLLDWIISLFMDVPFEIISVFLADLVDNPTTPKITIGIGIRYFQDMMQIFFLFFDWLMIQILLNVPPRGQM